MCVGMTFAQQLKPIVFVYENTTKTTSDSLIKLGQLNINDSSYEITKFTYVISGYSCENDKPRFGILTSNKFSKQMTIDLKQAIGHHRSVLYIQDIFLRNKLIKNSKPFKTENSLRIEF